MGVRVWGPGPSDPDVAAAAARIFGAPVPERVTSVRIPGYPAAVALSTDDYAQLRRAAAEIFGGRVPIRVRRCTQLASTDLEGPVFDLLLEGVPVDWAGMFLPSVDSSVPDRVWEWIVHRNQAAPYVPVGPRDRMVRVPAARQPPTVDPPPATSSAPQPVQPEMDDVDMAPRGPLRTMSPWMARAHGLRQNWRRRTKKSCSLVSPDPPITPPGGSVGVVPANGGGLGLGGVASAFCAYCTPPSGSSGCSLGRPTLPLPHAPRRMRGSAAPVLSGMPP